MDRSHPLWPYFAQTTERANTCYEEAGPWMTGHVTTMLMWPTQKQIVFFRDLEFLLLPSTDDWMPAIALNMRTNSIGSEAEARTAISRFASAISWRLQAALAIDGFTFDGDSPVHHVRRRPVLSSDFLYTSLGEVEHITDPVALRALALYREGLSTQNDFYAALNFFKVIENFVQDGRDREAWFSTFLPRISIPAITARIAEIQASNPSGSVGKYLSDRGRNAIAHSRTANAVDPDDDDERNRFASDIEIYKVLAKSAITEFIGLKGGQDGLSEPDDQIKPFMKAQDGQYLGWIRYRDRPQPPDVVPVLPDTVTLIARRKGETVALEGVMPSSYSFPAHSLRVVFVASHSAATITFTFDLAKRKLICGPIKYPEIDRSNAPEKLTAVRDVLKFHRLLFTGGVAWILDAADHSVFAHTNYLVPIYGTHDSLLLELAPREAQVAALLDQHHVPPSA